MGVLRGRRRRMMKKTAKSLFINLVLVIFSIIFMYPLLWFLAGSFGDNDKILQNFSLIPKNISFNAYTLGWRGSGQYTFGSFVINTFKLVIPSVAATLGSSVIVAYGFARFRFIFRDFLFTLMLATLMLPGVVTLIPQYILFNRLGWVNNYKPFIIPAIFGGSPFYIYLMIQFFRGLPKELDESAKIDGCNSLMILLRILVPLSKPAIFSVCVLQFVGMWNNFMGVLIYVNSVSKYTVSLGLRMSLDIMEKTKWNQIMAMTVVSILPPTLLFFAAQKYFVEGIATSGLKG